MSKREKYFGKQLKLLDKLSKNLNIVKNNNIRWDFEWWLLKS